MNHGLALLPAKYGRVQKVLSRLCRQVGASEAILASTSGQLLCDVQIGSGPNPTVLAVLAASALSATTEMAKVLGEAEPFRTVLHEGNRQSLYIAGVSSSYLLVVVFDPTIPIGLVRLCTRPAIAELSEASGLGTLLGGDLSPEFGQGLAEELERSLVG